MLPNEFDLTTIAQGETYIIRLPKGRMMELEWLDTEGHRIRVVGLECQADYDADEQYRRAGHQPLLHNFSEYIEMID